MKSKGKKSVIKPSRPRVHKVTFLLNDQEYGVVERYLRKYRVRNKSRCYREILLSHVVRTLVEDYPTLFKEEEMR